VDKELKEIYQRLIRFLKKKKKIVYWIAFVFGVYSIIGGFFAPINFVWGTPLTIVGSLLLKGELKKITRISPFGPALVILGFILIIIGIPLSFFLPALFGWGIFLLIIGIPLATTNLLLKHHVIDDWSHLIEGAQGRAGEILKGQKIL